MSGNKAKLEEGEILVTPISKDKKFYALDNYSGQMRLVRELQWKDGRIRKAICVRNIGESILTNVAVIGDNLELFEEKQN